jgi:hypothetical protein
MAPSGNMRWPHTTLLTGSTSGPKRQYRWPPQAQILTDPSGASGSSTQSNCVSSPGGYSMIAFGRFVTCAQARHAGRNFRSLTCRVSVG